MENDKLQEIINRVSAYGIRPGLDSVRELCDRLGDLQDELNIIHVAGTNGKGSVCLYIAQALCGLKKKVLSFTSPLVYRYEDMWRYNTKIVDRKTLLEVFNEVEDEASRMEYHPTLFEMETAVTFVLAKKLECDYLILETGMGGTLDATNIIKKPIVSVITNIDYDHSAFLGDTIEEIASNKAGIIKEGCPVVSAFQRPEVSAVLDERAKIMNAEITYTKEKFPDFKAKNTETAITALKIAGITFDEESIRKIIKKTYLPARFEKIGGNTYVDGGHNPAAARVLRSIIDRELSGVKKAYVFGMLKDKDYGKYLDIMRDKEADAFFITPDNQRALKADELCRVAQSRFKTASVCDDSDFGLNENIRQAVLKAKSAVGEDGAVIIAGSFSFMKNLKEIIDMGEQMF